MIRRRGKSLLIKIIIGIPLLWFTLIGISVIFHGSEDYHPDRPIRDSGLMDSPNHLPNDPGKEYIARNTRRPADFQPPQEVPVLEQPNPDWFRLQEKMRQDAAQALRDKERQRHMQQSEPGEPPRVVPPVETSNKYYRPVGKKEIPDDPNAPGENGAGMSINKEELSPEERAKYEEGFRRNAFNQYASDKMSLHRTLPDVRDVECTYRQYRDSLPDTSVIVIFHNEAWSVLIRTVYSIIDRTPPQLLKEVILVDDFSDYDHLKEPLQQFVDSHDKLHLIRGKKREGLIRARLLGASAARGQVLTFLDSHCECTQGWLEPMLDRIADNHTNVVTPVIDVIDDETIRYQHGSAKSTSVGGFDWNLQFNWHGIPEHERKRRKSDVDPVRSPTMAGGLFAISREYFEYLGAYDPGMDIWGGENLELSFRTWMCGGTLEIVLCSHVGHIFRKRSPYSWKTGGNVLRKNSIRLAEVWMDDFKKHYYERFNYELIWMCGGSLEIVPCSHVGHIFRKRSPYTWKTGVNAVKKNSIRLAEVWMDNHKNYYYERFNFDLGDYGDVSARKALRDRLHCKSFKWYLDNIYPDLFIPGEALASGEIKNKVNGRFNGQSQPACLDSPADKKAYNKPIKLWPCHNMGGNQYWMLSKSGEIRRDEGCLDYAGQFVMIYPCHQMKGNQEWVYGPDNTLRHKNTNLCLELSEDGTKIETKPCTGIDRQIWYWKRKVPDSEGNKDKAVAVR